MKKTTYAILIMLAFLFVCYIIGHIYFLLL